MSQPRGIYHGNIIYKKKTNWMASSTRPLKRVRRDKMRHSYRLCLEKRSSQYFSPLISWAVCSPLSSRRPSVLFVAEGVSSGIKVWRVCTCIFCFPAVFMYPGSHVVFICVWFFFFWLSVLFVSHQKLFSKPLLGVLCVACGCSLLKVILCEWIIVILCIIALYLHLCNVKKVCIL